MTLPEIRKQISIFLSVSDWQMITLEAARQKIPVTQLCRKWMEPHVEKLRMNKQKQQLLEEVRTSFRPQRK